MTDQDAHTPTEQETAIYDALTAGDHDTIEQMSADAHDDPTDEAAAAQFDEDYAHAHAHYQADHEAPERDRVEATADTVEDENLEAR